MRSFADDQPFRTVPDSIWRAQFAREHQNHWKLLLLARQLGVKRYKAAEIVYEMTRYLGVDRKMSDSDALDLARESPDLMAKIKEAVDNDYGYKHYSETVSKNMAEATNKLIENVMLSRGSKWIGG